MKKISLFDQSPQTNTAALINQLLSNIKGTHRWHAILTVLASIVVFCTTYVLILPAITWDRMLICTIKEHEHSEKCYTDGVLSCGLEEHIHTDACFDAPPMEDPGVYCGHIEHVHNENCYFEDGSLRCTIEEHVHTDMCEQRDLDNYDIDPMPGILRMLNLSGEEAGTLLEKTETEQSEAAAVFEEQPLLFAMFGASNGDNEEQPVLNTRIDLGDSNNSYILAEGTAFEYTLDEGDIKTWHSVLDAPETGIPGDAQLRMTIAFGGIRYNQLADADFMLEYEIPEALRDAAINEMIKSGDDNVGTLSIEDGKVVLLIDQNWAEDKSKDSSNPTISGFFYVYGTADLSEVSGEDGYTVDIGPNSYELHFEDDIVEKYAEVDIEKSQPSVVHDGDHVYLEYEVIVTAGPDGSPDTTVVDCFRENEYTEPDGDKAGYFGIEAPDGTTARTVRYADSMDPKTGMNPTALYWEIGDMAPYERKEIVYRVEIPNDLVGSGEEVSLFNEAEVYSDVYPKDDDVSNFFSDNTATIAKSRNSAYTISGSDYIYTYTVTVTADPRNSEALNSVTVTDTLLNNREELRPYLYYTNTNYWELTRGGATTRIDPSDIVFSEDSNEDGKKNESFSIHIDSLAPGESAYLEYDIIIKGDYLNNVPLSGNKMDGTNTPDTQICNTALLSLDDGMTYIDQGEYKSNLNHQKWARKLNNEQLEEDKKITISQTDAVYTYSPDSTPAIRPETAPPSVFTVLKDSFVYKVATNEAGNWDIGSASLKDAFKKDYMKYQGYVRMDAYEINTDAPKSSLSDADLIANLENRPILKTTWIKVDDLSSFDFTPQDVGFDGKQAYVLTYYARPEGISAEELRNNNIVDNDFSIEGQIGKDGKVYTIPAVTVTVSVDAMSNTSINVNKYAWYYATTVQENREGYDNGAIYWVIEIDAASLPAGFQLRDRPGNLFHYYRPDSYVGFYTGNLHDPETGERRSIVSYSDLEDLMQNETLTKLEDSLFNIVYYNTQYVNSMTSSGVVDPSRLSGNVAKSNIMTLNRELTLEDGDSLYIIYRTAAPVISKSDNYRNLLNYRESSADSWSIDLNVPMYVYKDWYMNKAAITGECSEGVISGSLSNYVKGNSTFKDGTTLKNGKYIGWDVKTDLNDNMDGTYRFIDTMPEGLETEFVYLYRVASQFTSTGNNKLPTFVQLDPETIPIPDGYEGKEWVEHTSGMIGHLGLISNNTSFTTYWYTCGDLVLFEIQDYHSPIGNKNGVEVVIGTRVIDPEVLLEGKEKEFVNIIDIYNEEGKVLDRKQAAVSIQQISLSKKCTDEVARGHNLSFQITVNEDGYDLVADEDSYSVVDDLSETLTFLPESLQVLLHGTETPAEGWQLTSSQDHSFALSLPDGVALDIRYRARVEALPGEPVSISNEAHFSGHEASQDSTYSPENEYYYTSGGGVQFTDPPSVKVIKKDYFEPSKFVRGAQFKLDRYIVNSNGSLVYDAALGTETTNMAGELTFGENSSLTLDVDTVYCLTEISAPYGYILDQTPHFFAVVKQRTDGSYMTFPEKVTRWAYENSPRYTVTLSNVPILPALPATGGMTREAVYWIGGILIGTSVCGLILLNFIAAKKRKKKSRG